MQPTTIVSESARLSFPRRLGRFGGYLLLALGLAFVVMLLVLRFWLLPKVENYRPQIAQRIAQTLGSEVEIETLSAGWSGWNPTFTFRNLSVKNQAGERLLSLPLVAATVSWRSLFLLELRLRSLLVVEPRLALHRDKNGVLHIAGVGLDSNRPAESRFTNWLLRQQQVVVKDALLTWQDDYRNSPQLVLDHVDFRLESRGRRHAFGLRGTPPSELAAPIDLRGYFYGRDVEDWRNFSGQLYARLDYADVAAWQEWLPFLPINLRAGEGALRLWVEFDQATSVSLTADVELQRVRTRLHEKLPEMQLTHAQGRLAWRHVGAKSIFLTRHLTAQAVDGTRIEPTDFELTVTPGSGRVPESGEMKFNQIQLDSLRRIADRLPLDKKLQETLARFAPEGSVRNGHIEWSARDGKIERYAFRGRFQELGFTANDAWPGVSKLTGNIDGDQDQGTLVIAGKQTTVRLPKIFVEPIAFQNLSAQIGWARKGEELRLKFSDMAFSNAHAAGTATIEYHTLPQGPGWINASAHLTHADPRAVHQYIPIDVPQDARDWLRLALLGGSASEVKLKLQGDLAQFPFAREKSGVFQVTAKVSNTILQYADHWPKIESISGSLQFRGSGLEIKAQEASTVGVKLRNVSTTIADLSQPRVVVEAEAMDALSDFFAYVKASPLQAHMGGLLSPANARGDAHLKLALDLPTWRMEESKVRGELTFLNNRVKLQEEMPELHRVNGRVSFTENRVSADNVAADILGGPAKIAIAKSAQGLTVSAQGTANLASLAAEYEAPWARHLSGSSDWHYALESREDALSWKLDASLSQALISLPVPFSKRIGEPMDLRVERRIVSSSATPSERVPSRAAAPPSTVRESTTVNYGKLAQVRIQRRIPEANASPVLERAVLLLGPQAIDRGVFPNRSGFWIRGTLPKLDIDQWRGLKLWDSGAGDRGGASARTVDGIDLNVAELDVFARRWHNQHLVATRQGSGWEISLQGDEALGKAQWRSTSSDAPNGKLVARLAHFKLGPETTDADTVGDQKEEAKIDWPALDVAAESFWLKGQDLGKLELYAKPEANGWRIERLQLANSDGSLQASGIWNAAAARQQTKVDVELEVSDAGRYLARFGFPQVLKGGRSRLQAQLSWAGNPQEIDYPTLSGSLHLEAEKGQFIKVDPGIGKLLGVLSLQSLPRRISLDFRDIFSEGFAFDQIRGDVQIKGGVLSSDNIRIDGPAAKVQLAGEANLNTETQRIRVKVQPSVSTSVAVGAALAVNPLAGAALFGVQKLLKDPFEQMLAYEYQVTGKWTEPQVQKVAAAPRPADTSKQ